jgi:transposase
MNTGSPLNEIMALRAALAQAEARADAAEADAAQARAKVSSDQAFIAYL